MPNLGAMLKSEITRLSRKTVKSESDVLKRLSSQHRREIAALKRQVASLEKSVSRLGHLMQLEKPKIAEPTSGVQALTRFMPKGLVSMRKRLGLSQSGMAALLGVSMQSVHNWEHGTTRPRTEQLQKIVALRNVTRAQVDAHLDA